jgi:hypothetical protein
MNDRFRRTFVILCTILFLAGAAGISLAEEEKKAEGEKKKPSVDCDMSFSLKGWSAFYKTAKGEGTITCSNGQSAKVRLKAKGGGISFGKSEILDGRGDFSAVFDIGELYGSYAQSEAHAGAGKEAGAQALTKGGVNLSLSGTGRGVSIGFAFGRFTIEPGQ